MYFTLSKFVYISLKCYEKYEALYYDCGFLGGDTV
jgi:hypothetical protein